MGVPDEIAPPARPVRFRRVLVCGVGLIGGSFALALKRADIVDQVVGMGRSAQALDVARNLGIIDRTCVEWQEAMAGTDLVLLGMPVGQMPGALAALVPHLGRGALITDVGSTKSDVISAARQALGERIGQFVPGHPIAGAEKSGAAAAREDLFDDRRVVLTPLAENAPDAVARIRNAWEACGAAVTLLSASAHDQVFAAVSHLPHLLAFALVHEFAGRSNADELFGFAAGGFRDFTRIASSHPEMWRDICIANRQPLLGELDAYLAELMRTRALLAKADGDGLTAMFDLARTRRDAWLATRT